jgi:hypothetical protein
VTAVGTDETARRVAAAAAGWLSTLDDEARAKAAFAFDSADRLRWAYVPGDRTGLSLGAMREDQRAAAFELVRATMSARGAGEVEGIIALEPILGELERAGGRGGWLRRDADRYWFAVYGDPAGTGPWSWRLEGHHVSVRATVADGRVVSATPSFLGANPATVPSGPLAGRCTLHGEETLARALLLAMSPDERSVAVVDPVAPPDIVSGTGRRPDLRQVPAGIARASLGPERRDALDRLVRHYLDRMAPDVAQAAWARLVDAGLDELSFAWAGGDRPGHGHYYAIRGPSVLIEYDNTQNGANHIHSVWRDPANDWGDDVLATHYRVAHGAG